MGTWKAWTVRRGMAWAALVAMSGLAGCSNHEAPPAEPKEPEGVAQARLAPVTVRPMRQTGEFLGVTEPEPNSVAAVSALISARILQLPLREGDAVHAGQTVAVLDAGESPAQLAQARAQLEAAVNDIGQADTAIAQEKSRVTNDRRLAETAIVAAQAQVSRAESELKALQASDQADLVKSQAALDTAQRDLTRIKAGSRPQEIAVARAAVAEADAQRQNAAAQETRANRLFQQQVLSRKQWEDAQAQARVARAQYVAAVERQRLAEEGSSPAEIAVAEARVREAEAGVEASRTTALTEGSKKEEIAGAQAAVAQARVGLERALAAGRDVQLREQQRRRSQAQYRQSQAALEQVVARNRLLRVTAPVSGVISRRAANQGETAQPGSVLVEIARPGQVRFRISAPETRLASLRVGQPAEVRFDTLGSTPHSARVSVLGSSADTNGNGIVWLRVEGAGLRPGLSGTARITLKQSTSTAVPVSALIEGEGGDEVVVVDRDHVAHHRKVKPGVRDGEWVQVSGLKAGEQVATTGAYVIADGMKVTPIEDAPAQP